MRHICRFVNSSPLNAHLYDFLRNRELVPAYFPPAENTQATYEGHQSDAEADKVSTEMTQTASASDLSG